MDDYCHDYQHQAKRPLLQKLEDLLRADAVNPTGVKFDLGMWAEPNEEAPEELVDPATLQSSKDLDWKIDAKVPVSCGTTACAFGLGAISGTFANEGLRYEVDGGTLVPVINDMNGMRRVGFAAARVLFNISEEDAEYLFDPSKYDGDTPEGAHGEIRVADRIKAFSAGKVCSDHPDFEEDPDW